MDRKAGILLHISSLPNKYGIGTLGKEAYRFVDFLEKSGQKYWQVLPITPTNYGDSPYQSSSVYAFNPYFIDLDMLYEMGLLRKCEYQKEFYGSNPQDTDYACLFYTKNKVLKLVWGRHEKYNKEFKKFCKDNASWLDGYALYEAIKESFGFTAWNTWPTEYKLRDEKTIKNFIKEHKDEIELKKFIQWLFYYQWMNLKAYAAAKGIEIIGDMPIYVAYDSADVWFNPDMFWLDADLNPVKVAGCPPDGFSPDGQLWGNPLYRWDLMKEQNYSWWVERIKKSSELFDIVRIDHFRGFAGYFTIPFGDQTARNGSWMVGPGYDLFRVINEELPGTKIIAENLGFLDQSVTDLLDACGYPGMCIMQFDFGNGYDYSPLKEGLAENNVIYTGTHDNQTILSWYYDSSDHLKWCIREHFGVKEGDQVHLKIIEGTLKETPYIAIIPFQDYLGLVDWQGRMNIPSTLGCNWRWRSLRSHYNADLAKYIRKITKESGRL